MALAGIAPPRRSRGLPESTQREFDQWYEWVLRLRGFIGQLAGITITVTVGASTNNLGPAQFHKASYVRLSASTAVNITGLVAPQGLLTRKTLINVGAANITLTHADTASSAPNRFTIPGGISLTLLPNDTVDVWYDATSTSLTWRPI